jgi:hypothetical protein
MALAAFVAASVSAAEIGQIKVSNGQVTVERKGESRPGSVGTRLESSDVVRTGAAGSVGITMVDNSLLSAGPNSILSLDRFDFDPTSNQGRFDAQLQKGSLAGSPAASLAGAGGDGAHAVDDLGVRGNRVRRGGE